MKNEDQGKKHTERLMKAGILTGVCVSLYLLYYFIFPAFGAILSFIVPILLPFIFALVIAVLIDPVITFVSSRLRLPRGWAVLAVLTFFITIISAFLVFFTSQLIYELYKLSRTIPNLTGLAYELLEKAQKMYANINLPPEVLNRIQEAASHIAAALTTGITMIINWLVGFIAALPSILIMLLITLIATFFFSRDRERLQNVFIDALPRRWRVRVRSVYMDLTVALVGYFRAQATLISLTTLTTIIGLSLIGVDYAITMGLLTGFFDILPILGPGSVFVPWIIWTLVSGKLKLAASLGVLYVMIVVVRQIMEPKLVAQKIGVHPLATLAAIFIGLKTFGVVGVILGPAALVVIKAVQKAKTI